MEIGKNARIHRSKSVIEGEQRFQEAFLAQVDIISAQVQYLTSVEILSDFIVKLARNREEAQIAFRIRVFCGFTRLMTNREPTRTRAGVFIHISTKFRRQSQE